MYFDLHMHILPAFDDGAADIEISLAMLKLAVEQGTTGLVATPHLAEGDWFPPWEKILDACSMLTAEARRHDLAVSIYPGAEVAFYSGIEKIVQGPGLYCINGGRYMLVELPGAQLPYAVEDFFFTLQARGIVPILAHPERNRGLIERPELLVNWIERGILLQVNSSSILGRMGARVQKMAHELLLCNMIHCVASDAHGDTSRRPGLNQVARRITELVGSQTTELLLSVNPRRIIRDETIIVPEPQHRKLLNYRSPLKKWFSKFGF